MILSLVVGEASLKFFAFFFISGNNDISGFVRLFYILSKNKIFFEFWQNILDF